MREETEKRPAQSRMLFRVLFYLAGLLVLAFGVVLAKKAMLGISPVSSTPLAIFEALSLHNATALTIGGFTYNLTFGNCVTIFYCFCILVQILILRREYKIYNLLQIFISFVFGWFVDFAGFVMSWFSVQAYPARLLLTLLSVGVIAVGISLYLAPRLMLMPSEGVGIVIAEKLRRPYHKIKVVIDCAMVACAILVMLAAGGNPFAIVREGTVIIAATVGLVMGLLKRFIDPLAARLCFGAAPAEGNAAGTAR